MGGDDVEHAGFRPGVASDEARSEDAGRGAPIAACVVCVSARLVFASRSTRRERAARRHRAAARGKAGRDRLQRPPRRRERACSFDGLRRWHAGGARHRRHRAWTPGSRGASPPPARARPPPRRADPDDRPPHRRREARGSDRRGRSPVAGHGSRSLPRRAGGGSGGPPASRARPREAPCSKASRRHTRVPRPRRRPCRDRPRRAQSISTQRRSAAERLTASSTFCPASPSAKVAGAGSAGSALPRMRSPMAAKSRV